MYRIATSFILETKVHRLLTRPWQNQFLYLKPFSTYYQQESLFFVFFFNSWREVSVIHSCMMPILWLKAWMIEVGPSYICKDLFTRYFNLDI